jgi:hypothetical protein
MRNTLRLFVIGSSVAIMSPFARTVGAQDAGNGTVLHLTPYVGYMIHGDYLKGPLGTDVTNAPGLIYGAQANLSLSPNLSLIGNLGYTSSDLTVGIPILGSTSIGSSSILMYDAGLEYALGPSKAGTSAITPFVQAGVGAMRYNIDASILNTQATNFAWNVGGGVDMSIARGMALRVMAKDYIGKFNFQDATGFGINGPTANNIALSAGLRFDF